MNMVTAHKYEDVRYPPFSSFRVVNFDNFVSKDMCGFNAINGVFVRQRYECDMTFSETLELKSFPVDIQDFTIIFRETTGVNKVHLVPEPRYINQNDDKKEIQKPSNFFGLDKTFSVLDEWNFYSIHVEFANSLNENSRSSKIYKEITLRFKLIRRWSVYFWNIIFYFMIITFLSLSCFSMLIIYTSIYATYNTILYDCF